MGAVALMISSQAVALNPIVPMGKFMSDPAARVFDGKVYLYGSRDDSKNYYCSKYYDVWASADLTHWTEYHDTFASVGKNDQVDYFDGDLYAPDCIKKGNTYYLVYSNAGAGEVQGIATASKPYGPFKHGQLLKGVTQIDPAFFQDDDGQMYLYWGQFAGKVAKMKPNMHEVDWTTYRDSIITEKDHCFHEGIQMIKRNGIYYLVYANIGRHGMATSIGYSYGHSPYGPFKYGGIIVDNFGCDPNVWNNHGSIVEYKGKWYVFYHRATNGVVSMRKACVEPITFNPDGTINEAEMTTQGADGPLDPTVTMDAARACTLTGNVRVELKNDTTEWLTGVRNLNTAVWKYFDFKKQPKKFTITLTPLEGGHITVFANNLCLPVLASFDVPKGNGVDPVTITVDVTDKISGVHPVYMRFSGKEDVNLFNVQSFKFE